MKRSTINAINLENIFRSASMSFLFLSFFFAAGAQKATDSTNVGAASVTYLGYDKDQLIFAMKYSNDSGEKYAVSITDADKNILYTGIFSDKKFSKTFMVPSAESSLTFIISNPKNKKEKKFQVNMEQHYTEEVSVTKIKEHL